MPLTLLVGGARSGKSRFAVDLGRRHEDGGGSVRFVATGARAEGDPDWDARIDRHVAERPPWPTIEEPVNLVAALAAAGDDLVIIDCLTLWVSNQMVAGLDDDTIVVAADRFGAAAGARRAPTVVVTNEVGLGIHPEHALGRRFRDVLGTVNQRVAAAADRTLWFVAGRAMLLCDPTDLVSDDR